MYGESRPTSMQIAMGLKTASAGGKFLKTFLTGSPLSGFVNNLVQWEEINLDFVKAPPLHIDQVAQAVLAAIESETVEGIFEPVDTLVWRQIRKVKQYVMWCCYDA